MSVFHYVVSELEATWLGLEKTTQEGGNPIPSSLGESQGKRTRLQTDCIIVGSTHPPASVPPPGGIAPQVPG